MTQDEFNFVLETSYDSNYPALIEEWHSTEGKNIGEMIYNWGFEVFQIGFEKGMKAMVATKSSIKERTQK